MSFIPKKKGRKAGHDYKSYLTPKTDESKRKETYKSYLTSSTEQIPRSSIKRRQEECRQQPQPLEGVACSSSHAETDFPVCEGSEIHSGDEGHSDSSEEFTLHEFSKDKYDSNWSSESSQSSDEDSIGSDILSDDSEDSDFPRANFEDTVPLYEGSKIELSAAVSSILNFYISNSLSKQGLNDLLKLIDSLLPSPNLLPKTKYKLEQFVLKNAPSSDYCKHYYCSCCHYYFGVEDNTTECPLCNSKSEKSFFLTYSLKDILKNFLENGIAYKHLLGSSADTELVHDITQGVCFKHLKEENNLSSKDLTLIWNTDGVPVFKSSKSQLWPLQFTIAELPPEVRNKYVIVCGLWYSHEKPEMNTFLRPFSEELIELEKSGFDWCRPDTKKLITSKVSAPIACLDAVARAAVMNIHQFNGEYGCNVCEEKGMMIQCGQGSSRIYPIEEEVVLRTKESMAQYAQEAVESANIVKGVKGPSTLSLLVHFNIAQAFVPDYLHCVLLGVVRQFLFLWMSPNNSAKPWSLSRRKIEMDNILLNIKPPLEITRLPRSLELRKYWKASEYRAWLLFYSVPTLANILPKKYFEHWLLLVFSVFTLLKDTITKLEIELSSTLLRIFCSNVEILYGQEQLTFNVHQLLHLPLSVERWGPLWATSAFCFENNNGLLLKLIHGTQQISIQIANTFKYVNGLCVFRSRIVKNYEVLTNLEPYIGSSLKVKPILSASEQLTISSYFSCDVDQIMFFSKFFLGKTLYTSLLHKKTKRNNYSVMYSVLFECESVTLVGFIKFILKKKGQKDIFLAIERHEIVKDAYCNKECGIKIEHLIRINPHSSSLDIVPLSGIMKKLVYLSDNLLAYHPNCYESNL